MSVATFGLWVDWDADGVFTDESSRLVSFSTERGRNGLVRGNSGYQAVEAGRARVQLDNYDGRFNPFNASGALFGYLRPGRMARLTMSFEGVEKPLFTGWVRDIRPSEDGKVATMTLADGIDALDSRSFAEMTMQTNYPVADALKDLVVGGGWPYVDEGFTFPATLPASYGDGAIEDNSDQLAWFWAAPEVSIWKQLTEIGEAFAGDVFVAADGTFSFRARRYGGQAIATITEDMLLGDLEMQMPWDEIRNRAIVEAYPRQATASGTELWKLNDIPEIPAGGTLTIWANFQYNGDPIPASTVITPVATTDYTANRARDGSGGSETGAIAITMTTYGACAKLAIKNNAAVTVYLTLMRLRGTGLFVQSVTPCREDDEDSQSEYGVLSLEMANRWVQSVEVARNAAKFAVMTLTAERRAFWATLEARWELQQGLELFDTVYLDLETLGVEGDYFVTWIGHSWRAGQGLLSRYRFEETPEEAIGGFMVFDAVLGSNNRLVW